METAFYFKNMVAKDEEILREYVLQKLDKFERMVSGYPKDAVVFEIKAERFEKHNAYEIEFLLKLPSEILTATEASHFITKAVDKAKARLEVQLKKHIDSARKHKTVKGGKSATVGAMLAEGINA